jgi:hypothetical protein
MASAQATSPRSPRLARLIAPTEPPGRRPGRPPPRSRASGPDGWRWRSSRRRGRCGARR